MQNAQQNIIKQNPRIIHYNKMGFIPDMQGWFNIQKSTNVIHQVKEEKSYNNINAHRKSI